jgi:2-dehydro-3-deoxyphosphogluconate aldolase / (4S)-4-hydroxy-2-oxoglutarate aldolase
MTTDIVTSLRELGVIPLIVIDDPNHAGALVRALVDGGLPCAEIALRTEGAMEALRQIADEHPGMAVGAGTVLTVEQAAQASYAGAKFIVSPGMNPRVVDFCLGQAIPVFPGVCTPTEIETAMALGLDVLKFFPAEPMGGLPLLQAIAAPYGSVEFIPTGGINAGNLAAYLGFDRVLACAGSWLAPQAWIAAEEFQRIREAAAEAVGIVRAARQSK